MEFINNKQLNYNDKLIIDNNFKLNTNLNNKLNNLKNYENEAKDSGSPI